jgi:membrane protein implicated in regulation of membrane protease activity
MHIAPEHWLILGGVLLIAEVSTGSTYLLWPAVAAGVVGALAYLGLSEPICVAVFAVLVLVLTYFGRPLAQRIMKKGAPVLNDRATNMIGSRCIAANDFVSGVGEVKINDSIWRATCDEPVEAGAALVIVAADGMVLKVKRAS